MRVITSPHEFDNEFHNEFNEDGLYGDLGDISESSLHLKCEGFDFAGSIKLEPAVQLVEDVLFAGTGPRALSVVRGAHL